MSIRSAAEAALNAARLPLSEPLGQLLVACVREHDWSSLPPELAERAASLDLSRLAEAAADHRIAGCVSATLRHAPWVPPEVLADVASARGEVLGRHVRDIAELRRFEALFSEHSIPWVVFKGPVLSGYLYSRPDLRTSADIDILVAPGDARKAYDTLLGAGYRTAGDWAALQAINANEIELVTPWGTNVDLHWQLLYDGLFGGFGLDTEEILANRRTVPIGGQPVPTLDAVDTLIHIAMHAGFDGGTRLVWLKDIEQCILREPPAWDQVIARASEWRVGPVLAIMLMRAHRFLGVPLPDGLTQQLCPSRTWLRLERWAERVSPVPRLLYGPSLSRIVARASRTSVASSASSLARKLGLGLKYRIQGRA